MELELLVAADDRVTGVVAALEAHDDVGPLGEQVGRPCPFPRRPTGRQRSRIRACRADYEGSRAGPHRRRHLDPAVLAEQRQRVRRRSRPAARPSGRPPARQLRLLEVGREDDRALVVVAAVDDRVELLEHPVGAALGAEIVEVEEVDGDEPVEERQVAVLAALGFERLPDPRQQSPASSRSRPSGRRRSPPSSQHRQGRLAGPGRRPSARGHGRRRAARRSSRNSGGRRRRWRSAPAGGPCRIPVAGRRRRRESASAATPSSPLERARSMRRCRHSQGLAVSSSSISQPEPSQTPSGQVARAATSAGGSGTPTGPRGRTDPSGSPAAGCSGSAARSPPSGPRFGSAPLTRPRRARPRERRSRRRSSPGSRTSETGPGRRAARCRSARCGAWR